MKIAFDIDGCLNYLKEDLIRIGKEYFKSYGAEFHPEGYYLREIWSGAPQEAYDAFWEKYGYEIYTAPPRKGACEIIRNIREQGIKACYITTRDVTKIFGGVSFDVITGEWLKKYDIELPVHYRKDKDIAVRELGVELMVEDKPQNILKLQKVTKVLIFDHPYNSEMDGVHIKEWDQIPEHIFKAQKLAGGLYG